MSEELKPFELWARIMEMPRPSKVVDFPRSGPDGKPIGQIRLRVLTQEEQILSAAEAERFTKKAIKEIPKEDDAQLGYQNVYNNSAAVEILFRACRQKDSPEKTFFPSCDSIRKSLTADEVGVLMMHYYTTQSELGPIVAHLSAEEVEAWVTRLGEGGSRFPLDLLSSDAVRDLAFSLACQMYISRTDKSLLGLLPDESKTSESPLPEESTTSA